MLGLVLYLSISVPLLLAFEVSSLFPSFMEYLITSIYILDIPININTAVYINGFVSLNRKEIMKEYFKFWF